MKRTIPESKYFVTSHPGGALREQWIGGERSGRPPCQDLHQQIRYAVIPVRYINSHMRYLLCIFYINRRYNNYSFRKLTNFINRLYTITVTYAIFVILTFALPSGVICTPQTCLNVFY